MASSDKPKLSAHDKDTLAKLQDEYGIYDALGGAEHDGTCSQCETYARHGIHSDSCPNRGKIHMGWCSVAAWKAFRDGWFEEFGEMADFKQLAREKVAKAIAKGAIFQVEIVEGHPNTPKKPNWHQDTFVVTRPAVRTNPRYDLHFDPNKNNAFVGIGMAPGSLEEEHAKLRGKVIDLETTVGDLAAEVERLKNPGTVTFRVGGPAPDRPYDFRRSVQAEAYRQIKTAEDLVWRFADQRTLASVVHRWLIDKRDAHEIDTKSSIDVNIPWEARFRKQGRNEETIQFSDSEKAEIIDLIEKESKK